MPYGNILKWPPIQKLQQLSVRKESKCRICSMAERNVATKVKEMQFHGKQQEYFFNFVSHFRRQIICKTSVK